MTDDQIRQWATDIWGANLWTDLQIQRLKRFATKVVEQEREVCASAALSAPVKHPDQDIREACAIAIRARTAP